MSMRKREHEKDNVAENREKLMNEIQNDYEQNGKYAVTPITLRNIMLVGQTRTGKSTIKSLLANPTTIPEDLKLFSGTKNPVIESFHVTGKNVLLNIIDTPGLVERGTDQFEARDNENILRTIDVCINREFTKFHVICFCVAITCGINGQDVQILRLLLKMFGATVSKNSCLIITHCESKDEEERAKMELELMQDADFKEIVNFFKLGIFFSGALNRDRYNTGSDILINQFITISDYRMKLIEMFTDDIEPFALDITGFSELKRAREDRVLKEKEVQQAQIELQQKLDEIETMKSELGNKNTKIKEMRSNIEEHQRIITAWVEQCSTQERNQREIQRLLDDEKTKRQQAEETSQSERADRRLTEENLQQKQKAHDIAQKNFQQEQEAHYLTKEKLKQEEEARLLAEEKLTQKANEWRKREDELYKEYNRQVQALENETQLREKAEHQRDQAENRLKGKRGSSSCFLS